MARPPFRRPWRTIGSAAARGAVAAAAACVFVQTSAAADLFWLADDDGSLQFSNVPTDPRFRRLVSGVEPDAAALASVSPQRARVAGRSGHVAGRGPSPARSDPMSAAAGMASARQFDEVIAGAARISSFKDALLRAVIAVESALAPRAVSHECAQGHMQLMPATARRFGVADAFDRKQNVEGGACYLGSLLRTFGGDLTLALAAYNAGEANVARYGNTVPPFVETQNYVPKVLGRYRQYLQTD